jgi:hypothetical protein
VRRVHRRRVRDLCGSSLTSRTVGSAQETSPPHPRTTGQGHAPLRPPSADCSWRPPSHPLIQHSFILSNLFDIIICLINKIMFILSSFKIFHTITLSISPRRHRRGSLIVKRRGNSYFGRIAGSEFLPLLLYRVFK